MIYYKYKFIIKCEETIMKKKLFLIFMLSVLLFYITGCESSKNDIKDNNDNKSSLTDEEKIVLDASNEKIYNQRIYLVDQQMIDNDASLRSGFDEDIEFLKKLKSENLFASKFLNLYYDSNIDDFLNSYNDIELIKNCGVGIAMKNAVTELQKEADFITEDTNKEDGVYRFLVKYIKENP